MVISFRFRCQSHPHNVAAATIRSSVSPTHELVKNHHGRAINDCQTDGDTEHEKQRQRQVFHESHASTLFFRKLYAEEFG
jgi:hypothetical protein